MAKQLAYRLNEAILAIHESQGKRLSVIVPSGAIVTILEGLKRAADVSVLWDGKTVTIYNVDLLRRSALVEQRA